MTTSGVAAVRPRARGSVHTLRVRRWCDSSDCLFVDAHPIYTRTTIVLINRWRRARTASTRESVKMASKSMISACRAQIFLALRAGAASRRPTPTPLPSGGAAGGGPTPTPLPIPRACHPTLPGSQLESCDEASLTTAVEHRTPALAPWQIFFRTSKMETDPLCPPSPHLSSPPICVDMLNSETPTYESPVVYRTCK